MLLRFSPTSPYVRKVSVTLEEKELGQRVERVPTNPWDSNTDLATHNPLGKVPALVTDDGLVLHDSPLICEYLDCLSSAPRLIPESGPQRWRVLCMQALADGVLDAAVLYFLESAKRPEELRWSAWMERQLDKIRGALDVMQTDLPGLGEEITLGHIGAACALSYVDFRLPGEEWRSSRQDLARWYQEFAQRPSMRATEPQEPS